MVGCFRHDKKSEELCEAVEVGQRYIATTYCYQYDMLFVRIATVGDKSKTFQFTVRRSGMS